MAAIARRCKKNLAEKMASPSSKLYHFSLFVHPRARSHFASLLDLFNPERVPSSPCPQTTSSSHCQPLSVVSPFAHPLHSSPTSAFFLAPSTSSFLSLFSFRTFYFFHSSGFSLFRFTSVPSCTFFLSFVFSTSLFFSRFFALLTGCFPSARPRPILFPTVQLYTSQRSTRWIQAVANIIHFILIKG